MLEEFLWFEALIYLKYWIASGDQKTYAIISHEKFYHKLDEKTDNFDDEVMDIVAIEK